jgi:hypothetical protein
MGLFVIEKYSQALVQCDCGEVFNLAEYRPVERCPGCGCEFAIRTQIVNLSEGIEVEIDQESAY